MPSLIWTPPALADVQRLYRFLAARDVAAARRAAKAIRVGVGPLADQPRLGRARDDMPPGFREWLVPFGKTGYVVLYRCDKDVVAILAVRHQKEAGI